MEQGNSGGGTKRAERLSMAGLGLLAVIWGWGFVFSQMALNAGLGPAAVMFGRFVLAAILMGVVFHRQIAREYRRGQWKSGLAIGVLLFFGFYTQMLGLQRSSPANNAFITATYVVMVPFLWWAATRRRPRPILFVASALCLVGVAVLSLDVGAGLAASAGDALTLLSAFLFACHIVATGLLARTIHATVLVFMQMVVAAALSFVFFMVVDRDFSGFASLQGAGSVLYLGVLSTCVCYMIQTVAQRHVASSKAAILLATESLFGAFFSVLVGYDAFSLRMVLGGLVMFTAIILPDLGARRAEPGVPSNARKTGEPGCEAQGRLGAAKLPNPMPATSERSEERSGVQRDTHREAP